MISTIHAATSDKASASPPSDSASRRRARVPHKQRVEQLREEAEQLSLRLLAARRRADEGDDSAQEKKREARSVGVWEAVAMRQRRRREKAEQDNVQLRRLTHIQGRHLRGLRELLTKRPFRAAVDEQVRMLEGRTIRRTPSCIGELEATFQFLLGHMNREHTRVDKLWGLADMDQIPIASQQWLSTRESSIKFKQYAAVYKAVVPFPLDSVQDACWNRLMNPPLRNPFAEYFTLVEQQGDTIQLVLSTVDDEFKLRQKLCTTSRRFVQRDRVIIATSGISEPRGSIDMTSLGIKVHSTVLRVFREGEPLLSGERSTIVESFWGSRGLNLDAMTECSDKVFESYVDAGRTFTHSIMKLEIERIEELLVAQLLEGA